MFIHKMREKLFKRIFKIWARIGFESIMSLSGTITLLITRRSLVYIYSTYIVYIYIVYSILSPKLELSLKAETKANSNSALLAFLHSLMGGHVMCHDLHDLNDLLVLHNLHEVLSIPPSVMVLFQD